MGGEEVLSFELSRKSGASKIGRHRFRRQKAQCGDFARPFEVRPVFSLAERAENPGAQGPPPRREAPPDHALARTKPGPPNRSLVPSTTTGGYGDIWRQISCTAYTSHTRHDFLVARRPCCGADSTLILLAFFLEPPVGFEPTTC